MARYRWLVLVLVIAVMIIPACAKKQVTPVEKPAEQIPPPVVTPPSEQPAEQAPAIEEAAEIALEDVFFDFDKYSIREDYKQVLVKNAELLMANPSKRIRVEGHCDERGTNEYNMALGEKRAKAVIDFYTTYGIKSDRLSMISYGEEKPFDTGHDETAWAKNRRAHMMLQ